MALRCDNCSKGVQYGHNVSHAKNRTQKIFKPNLHSTRVVVGGSTVRAKLCTKCLRLYKKAIAQKAEVVVAEVATVTETPVTA